MLQDQKRIIFFKGPSDEKETQRVISSYAAKYCLERNYFKEGVYEIEVESCINCQEVVSNIC